MTVDSPNPTQLRQLGKNGPMIPAIGLGMMGASVVYGQIASDDDRLALLDHAWKIGARHWDTSDFYGDSEDLLGRWFRMHPERRQDIFLATKFGVIIPDDGNKMNSVIDSSPEYAKAAIEKNLKRLGVEYIDLYYVHRLDPKMPIEKTWEAMKELVHSGKVKYLGISEVTSSTVRRAHAIHPVSAIQVEYNLWTRDIEQDSGTHLLDTCKELGIAVVAYSPLGRGMLTGVYKAGATTTFDKGDFRAGLSRFQPEALAKNGRVIAEMEALANCKGCTTAQLALAWLLVQADNVFVIPGTKKVKYLEQNFAAGDVKMSAEEAQALRKLIDEAGLSGGRDALFGDYIDTVPL